MRSSGFRPAFVHFLGGLAVACVSLALYGPTIGFGFLAWDDFPLILRNPFFRGLGLEQLRWMFGESFHTGNYEPLHWLTMGLDFTLWGLNPGGYRLTAVLLHSLNAVLVFLLARRVFALADPGQGQGAAWSLSRASLVSALFFAVHPLRVEAVAWLSARHYLLSTAFCLLSALFYLEPAQRSRSSPWGSGSYWLSALFFALSLLSFPIAILFPVALVIADIYLLRRFQGKTGRTPGAVRLFLEKAPFFALAGVFGTVMLLSRLNLMAAFASHGPVERLSQTFYTMAFFLWKTAAPFRLSPIYEFPGSFHPFEPLYLISGSVVLAMTAALFRFRRRWPGALALWLAAMTLLLPIGGFAQSGVQLTADRYTYLPGVVAALALGAVVVWLRRRGGSRGPLTRGELWGSLAAFMILIGLGLMTSSQIRIWASSRDLWNHALKIDPASATAHTSLGLLSVHEGSMDEGIQHLEQALAIRPRSTLAWHNLAFAFEKKGRVAQAETLYRRALDLDPGFAQAHNNLAFLLMQRGAMDEAIAHYKRALEINPALESARRNLAVAIARKRP
jgi:protein O-mannosyl-transferase